MQFDFSIIPSIKRWTVAAPIFCLAIALPGCGDDSGLGVRYPVSGQVTYKDQPVETGTISFHPSTPEGRPASGQITKGAYSLTTLVPNDGALPGKYQVTVESKSVDTTELEAIAKGGQFHQDQAFAKAVKKAKSLVPSRYSLPATAKLDTEVKAESNALSFDLKD